MQPGQHGGALIRQMFLDAGAETEMRPFGIDQHGAELAVAEMLGQRRIKRRDHGGIDEVGLRLIQPQPQQAAIRLVPDLERLVHSLRPRPRHDAFGEFVAPRRVGGERPAQRHEIDFPPGLARAFVEGAETGARLPSSC